MGAMTSVANQEFQKTNSQSKNAKNSISPESMPGEQLLTKSAGQFDINLGMPFPYYCPAIC